MQNNRIERDSGKAAADGVPGHREPFRPEVRKNRMDIKSDGHEIRMYDLPSLCGFTRRRIGQGCLTTRLIRPTDRAKMVAASDGGPDGANA
jgi:hypothetical protein